MMQSALVMLGVLAISGGWVGVHGTESLALIQSVEPGLKAEAPSIEIAEPSVTNRVTAGVAAKPKRIQPGEPVTIFLKLRVAEGCHIYGFEKLKGSAVPTSIEIGLPDRLVPIDEWHGPKAKLERDGTRTFSGDLLFQRRFRIDARFREGVAKVPIQISYQVCNEAVCWPPEKKQLECQLEIIK